MVVDDNGVILLGEWIFNGLKYKYVSTESKENKESVWDCIDTIKREDGARKRMTRKQVKQKFNGF